MIQGLLSEHGIPSMLRRAAGFDVPDFLAAGPREVLVAERGRRPGPRGAGGNARHRVVGPAVSARRSGSDGSA